MLLGDPELVLTVPTEEIGDSVRDKVPVIDPSRIVTIRVLHNRLLHGVWSPPKRLLHDEGHHSTDNTHELVHALCGHCPRVMTTATYYRGTPDETAKLRALWGEPYVALTLKEAVAEGVIARPDFVVWPLLNDETLKVVNGEFEQKSVEGALEDVVPDLLDRCRAELYDTERGVWRRTTMFTAPGVRSAQHLSDAFNAAGLPTALVVGGTVNRWDAFEEVVSRRKALIQVNVVSEGVDLPMRVSVDLAPTMSPVRFQQGRVGRITRPTSETPTYICTNHNITRHSYLWAGIVPRAQIKAAQQAWGPDWKPTRRHMARALGLEGFGKFTVSSVPLADGTQISLYALQTKDGLHQYSVLLSPCSADPLYFQRTNVPTGDTGERRLDDGRVIRYAIKNYGRWTRIKAIPSADGYVSIRPQPITPNMRAWWERSAASRGLDPTFEPNAHQFTVLPVLSDARIRFSEA